MRITIPKIKARKGNEPIVVLTAYTAPFARILDKYVDILLVGDSLGMVLYGMDTTLPVSLEMMINHGKAVVKGSEKALVVVDMPFGSYQKSKEQAFKNAAKIMQETGCSAVKLEGGEEMAETTDFLTKRGIPVMAHIGLMPQQVNTLGGYSYQGKTKKSQEEILKSAKAIEEAGAFALVLEAVDAKLVGKITDKLTIPTIGIGASVNCDGQVLVTEDMAGLFEKTPKFVKKYGSLANELDLAVKMYTEEVKSKKFPAKENSFFNDKSLSKSEK